MASGHKGGLKFRLRAKGRAAHSAYPQLGDSAIERLLDVLAEIRAPIGGGAIFSAPATVNIGTAFRGLAANVIAPDAEATVFIRVVGRADEVGAKLEAILARHPR